MINLPKEILSSIAIIWPSFIANTVDMMAKILVFSLNENIIIIIKYCQASFHIWNYVRLRVKNIW